jgi:hypothetical protein
VALDVLAHDYLRWRLYHRCCVNGARNLWVSTNVIIYINIVSDRFDSPAILVKRAQRLRKETGDENYWAPLEKKKLTFGQRVEQTLARPFVVFFSEPMLIALTVFMSVCLIPSPYLRI